MRKLLAAAVLTIATLAVADPAGAGGWAVTTLDPLDGAPVAGEPFEVGFTVRQHGKTPVSLDDAGILVTAPDGTVTRFEAQPDGVVGHHTATVVLAAGEVMWAVDQGWFADHELGTLTVAGGATAAGSSDDTGSPWTVPLFVAAALLGGLGLADLGRGLVAKRRSVLAT